MLIKLPKRYTDLDADLGCFDCYGSDFRPSVFAMISTVTRLQLWEWFRTESPPKDRGYMWWDHENLDAIARDLEGKDDGHSGATAAHCLRIMQWIAKDGIDKFLGVRSRSRSHYHSKTHPSQFYPIFPASLG